MIHIITSNAVPVRSIHDYTDNFQIVHHTKRVVPLPFSETKMKHIFQVYMQAEMDYEESEYENTIDYEFHIHEMDSIVHSLDEIANAIVVQWKKERDDDAEEETIIVTACAPSWNHAACRYIDKKIHAKGMDTGCMDLYRTLRIVDTASMKRIVSNTLNTDMISPEEPVPFAYAMDRALIGLV